MSDDVNRAELEPLIRVGQQSGEHDWQSTGIAQAHCALCGQHSPTKQERPRYGCPGRKS